jgi:hypothetical protein
MKWRLGLTLLATAVSAAATEQSLSGKISDSICADRHNSNTEHQGEQLTDHDCTVACAKQGTTQPRAYDDDRTTWLSNSSRCAFAFAR